ncbi:hypothetical protein NDU88_006205, partial [Pleurodeles waltl]
RRVADSLALIRDTIQYITDWNIHAALVCLDQEKAFDRVSYVFMERVLQGFGLGERFYNYVRKMYTDIFSSVMSYSWSTSGRTRTSEGSRHQETQNKEVKCTLYMDDVTLFCTNGKSVQSLLEACKDFGKASGAKINMDKSQAKLFGRWDLCNGLSFSPLRQDW